MKRLIIIGIGIILPILATAQGVDPNAFGYYIDALNFSTSRPTGSARIMGLAGSNVALGADISSAYSNPAGLGMFNHSLVSITPAVSGSNYSSTFLGNQNSVNESRFNIYNGGFVFNNMKDDATEGFLGGSFGISITRVDDFNNAFGYFGRNTQNSIIDSWIEQSQGLFVEDLGTIPYLAWFNYLIGPETVYDPNGSPTDYFTDVYFFPDADPVYLQEESVVSEGSQYQWSIGYGANFSDRFYLGANIGLTSLRKDLLKTYREEFPNDDLVTDLSLNESLRIRANGFNATVGTIIRPIDQLRIGVSYTTPTLNNVDDEYQATLFTNWNGFDYEEIIYNEDTGLPEGTEVTFLEGEYVAESDVFISNYDLRAPSRLNTGAAFFIGKYGFLTADVEFVNHGNTRLEAQNFSMDADNNSISSVYRNTINMRFGAEARISSVMLRAGYARYGNPYRNTEIGSDVTSLSFGAGFRVKAFFADVAYVNSTSSDSYIPYFLSDGSNPVADISQKRNSVLLTLGLNF